MTIKLSKSIAHWGNDNFSCVLKKELVELGTNILPIQESATPGNFVNDSEIGITILTVSENKLNIEVKIGIIFSEIQWGYCCGEEDPMISNAYCEIYLSINKSTAEVEFDAL